MAVTKIWTIKDSLQRVLDYAANPDKTEYDALAQTLHYAENDAKTKLNESAQLVTGMVSKKATRPTLSSTRKTGSSGRNRSLRLPLTQGTNAIWILSTR